MKKAASAYEIIGDSADREEWLTLRRSGVGASESPCLLGEAKWDSEVSLAARKAGVIPEFEGNELTKAGLKLEPFIAEWALEEMAQEDEAAGRTPRKGLPYGMLIRSSHCPWMICTPDWMVLEEVPDWMVLEEVTGGKVEVPFQIKNTMRASDWDDGIPPAVMIQCQHELIVTGAPWGYAASLLTGNRLRWMKIEPDLPLQQRIIDVTNDFWHRFNAGDEMNVDGSLATSLALRAMHPDDNGETIPLSAELMEVARQLVTLKAEEKVTQGAKSLCENRLKAALGKATYGAFPDGTGVSFKTQEANIKAKEAHTRKSRVLRQHGGK